MSKQTDRELIAEVRQHAMGYLDRFEIRDWEEDAADYLLTLVTALEARLPGDGSREELAVTDEMVERGARELFNRSRPGNEFAESTWLEFRGEYLDETRAALSAALGEGKS